MEVEEQMLYINFNQDSSCFSTGTEKGFRVFCSYPFKDNYEKNLEGGIAIVEMLYKCNIIALVGGGKSPKFPPHKVILWDDHQSKVISELRFNSYVRNVKLKKEILVVAIDKKIFVFNFNNFSNIDTVETYENSKGILAISSDRSVNVIAYPDKTKGYVTVKKYESNSTISFVKTIPCHESPIAFLALNNNGELLASASENGTVIKIFKSDTGVLLQELRRGTEKAEIYYISFHESSKFIICSSDRGTIHIFSLHSALEKINSNNQVERNDEEKKIEPQNKKSIFSFIQKIINIDYFNSEWSFAQFRIPDLKSICAFGPNNTIIVVSSEGMYYQATFDPIKGGECIKEQECKLLGY